MAKVENSISLGGGGGSSIIVVANYSALPDPTTVSGKFYWAEASQGTSWLPGSLGGTYYNSGMYYSNGVSWTFMNVPYQATQAEVIAGINTDKFVTPNTLAGWWTNIKTLAQTIAGIWTWTNGTIYSPLTAPAYAKGLVFYDNSAESLAYYDDISGTTVNIGQEEFLRARNNTGATIPNGSVVYITGAIGQNPTIALARSNNLTTSVTIGVTTHSIANNTIGKVTTFGIVNELNTSGYTDGEILYLSSATAGLLTTTPPITPNYTVYVCVVLYSHPTLGKLFVRPEQPISLNVLLTEDNNVSPSVTAVRTYVENFVKILLDCNVLGANVSGGTHAVLYQITMPANTLSDLDVYEIEALMEKTGTAGSSSIRIWTDTASTFNAGTAVLLATSPTNGATNLFGTLKREFHVRGTTVKCLLATIGIATDESTSSLSANSWGTYTQDRTVANTLYFTVTGNAADSFQKQNFKMTRLKNKSAF